MTRALRILAVVFAVANAHAQNWTTVSASNITDLNQQKLAAGRLCFLVTDLNDNPISVMIGGGGQSLQRPYCSPVTNGAVTSFTVPNPANTSPANIAYRVTATDSSTGQTVLRYTSVQFTGASFNFDSYVPGFNLPLGSSAPVLSVGNLTVTGSCTGCGSGGSGSGYTTIQNAGTALAQRTTANFFNGLTCADNSGASRTDCQVDQSFSPTWTGTHTFNGTANIAGTFQIGGAAPQGKIPIGNGTSYVPGDPLVQGVYADGSTSAANPVAIGGYDTAGTPALHRAVALNSIPAGTEYGIVTRPIPSGTQTVSVSGTAAVSSTQLPSALDASGNLKVHEQGTATVSGTVTANIGTTNGLALDATLTGGSMKAQGNVASAVADSGNPVKIGGVFNTTQPTVTNGQRVDAQASARGELLIAKGVSGFSIDNTGFNVNNTPGVTQSGAWTVQPGNTANTTPWLTTDSSDGSTGSAVPSKASYTGGTDGANLVGWYLDPCKRGAKTRFTINLTASGQIITGTSSKKTYICDFNIVTATAQNIALVEGTGTTCATSIAGMAGGTTAATGWNFAANGGLTFGNGDASVFSADSANADNVCLLLSGTGQTSGSGHYVQF